MLIVAADEQYALRNASDEVIILEDFLRAACLVVQELCPVTVTIVTVGDMPPYHAAFGKMTPQAKKFYYALHDDEDNDTLEVAMASVPAAEFNFDTVCTNWFWKRFENTRTPFTRPTEPLIVHGVKRKDS
jgi:hypothetical protein